MQSFRYPLAGEFSITTGLVRANCIPGDWGLEIGTLCEVYGNCSVKRICQVDLIENYQRKHQELSPQDPDRGLMKMAVDIADTLFRTLATEGMIMSEAFFRTLSTFYQRSAEDAIQRYSDDAACDRFVEDSHGSLLIPNWNRVTSALPDFLDRLYEAVAEDHRLVMLEGSLTTAGRPDEI